MVRDNQEIVDQALTGCWFL